MITCVLTGHMSMPIVLNSMYIISRKSSNVNARSLLKKKIIFDNVGNNSKNMCYRWKRLPISSVAEQRNIEMLHEVSRELDK